MRGLVEMATGLIETSSLTHELIIFCQKVDGFSDEPSLMDKYVTYQTCHQHMLTPTNVSNITV